MAYDEAFDSCERETETVMNGDVGNEATYLCCFAV